jgi:hypothetical protein
MKKYIVILTVAAFTAVGYAGNKASANKNKNVSADKAVCPASAAAGSSCCANSKFAKKNCTKKIVQSPKAAGEAGR